MVRGPWLLSRLTVPDKRRLINMSRLMLFFLLYKTDFFDYTDIYATLINNIPPTWLWQYLHGRLSTSIISFPCFYSIVTAIYRGTYLTISTYLTPTRTAALIHQQSFPFLIFLYSCPYFLSIFNFLSLHINQSYWSGSRIGLDQLVFWGVFHEGLELVWHMFGLLVECFWCIYSIWWSRLVRGCWGCI